MNIPIQFDPSQIKFSIALSIEQLMPHCNEQIFTTGIIKIIEISNVNNICEKKGILINVPINAKIVDREIIEAQKTNLNVFEKLFLFKLVF